MGLLSLLGQKTSIDKPICAEGELKRARNRATFSIIPADTVTIRFSGKVQPSEVERQAWAFVNEWDAKVGAASGQSTEAAFNFAWESNPQNERAINQVEEKLRQVCSTPAAYQKLKKLAQQLENIQDPVLQKALLALKSEFDVYYSDNPEAAKAGRKATEAQNQVFKVAKRYSGKPLLLGQYVAPGSPLPYAERCKQLVKAQNAYAKLQAGSNWWDLGLVRPDEFNQLLDEMIPVLEEARALSEKISNMDLMLWQGTLRTIPFRDPHDESRFLRFEDILNHEDPHYTSHVDGAAQIEADSKFVEGKPPYLNPQCVEDFKYPTESSIRSPRISLRTVLEKTAERLGFPINGVLGNPNSRFHTRERGFDFTAPVNAPKEVWATANITGNTGWQADSENIESPIKGRVPHVLHEIAMHGGAYSLINDSLPRVLRTHDPVVAEGLGLMGNMLLPTELAWQKNVMQVDAANLKRLKPALVKQRLEELAAQVYGLKNALVTRALYRNPNQDMDKLFYEARQDIWRDKPAGGWAQYAYFVLSPQLDARYAISTLWMAQIAEYLEKHFGGIYTQEAGQYLKEHLAQGKMYDWQESSIALTGRPLSVKPLQRLVRKTYADIINELKKMGPQDE